VKYRLILPDGYQKQPLPGRDEWIAYLREHPEEQGIGALGLPEGPNCCLGELSKLQGRLTDYGTDSEASGHNAETCLSNDNPYCKFFTDVGEFPQGIYVSSMIDGVLDNQFDLANCNDAGLTFPQIADIIEAVWYNDGGILK